MEMHVNFLKVLLTTGESVCHSLLALSPHPLACPGLSLQTSLF